MSQELPKNHRFHASGVDVYSGMRRIAYARDIVTAKEICRALNQLDNICIVAEIPRPLKDYGKASNA